MIICYLPVKIIKFAGKLKSEKDENSVFVF